MNSPEEKAKTLVDTFFDSIDEHTDCDCHPVSGRRKAAKESALICVDEIISAITFPSPEIDYQRNYWQKVKEEIQKL